MKKTKKMIAIILAAVTVMACSVSSFAKAETNAYIELEYNGQYDYVFEAKGKPSATVALQPGQTLDIWQSCSDFTICFYVDGKLFDKTDSFAIKYTATSDVVIGIVQSGNNFYFTEKVLSDSAAQNNNASDTKNTQATEKPAAQSTPVNNSAPTAGVPDLSNPEIKALWDQAIAIKAAYDSETNIKTKKKLQKQFTEIMNQIPLG